MSEVKRLVAKLQQWYWSPMPPESYVVHTAAGNVGVGLIAHKNYAAFNLIWLSLPLSTRQDMQVANTAFMLMSLVTKVIIGNDTVGDHILTKTPQEFKLWYEANRAAFSQPASFTLDKVFENAKKLHQLPGL